MIHLQHNPYECFTTSNTPVGLYARQEWLGHKNDRDWKKAFEDTTAKLLDCQHDSGSWANSFPETVKRLFGLHLTVRNQTESISKALDWLLIKIRQSDTDGSTAIADLAGLPFEPGNNHILYPAMAMFLASIFGRSFHPEIISLYQHFSIHITGSSNFFSNHSDHCNILRAFAVHPEFSQSTATKLITEHMLSLQEKSGIWRHPITFYKTVNALAHLSLPDAERQTEKAFRLLSQTQNPDGTWGNAEKEWNTFLVVHAMRNKKIIK